MPSPVTIMPVVMPVVEGTANVYAPAVPVELNVIGVLVTVATACHTVSANLT